MAEFVLSVKQLLDSYAKMSAVCDIVSYSYKTNPTVGDVLEHETDCRFSVHSWELLQNISDKSRVLFFAQAWSPARVAELLALGVRKFSVDNERDLRILLDCLGDEQIILFLRMKLKEHTIKTEKYFVYGMRSSVVNNLILELSAHPRIEHLGVHVHRKTQNISEWDLQADLSATLSEASLRVLTYVNIGGGFPVTYKNSAAAHIDAILDKVALLRVWLDTHNISLIAEPGRFLAGPCISLHATILNMYDNTLIVDCSIFNAAMDTFIAHVRLHVAEEDPDGEPYLVKGISPDSPDILRYRVFLKNPQIGDMLTFVNAGAYNFCTDFCGFTPLVTRIV